MRVDNRRRSQIRAVRPKHRTRRGAGRAEDALGGRVEDFTVCRTLQPFARRGRSVVDKVRQHRLVRIEKRLHIDDHVFDNGKAANRFDGDGAAELTNQNLARQTVDAVDQHRVRAADTVRAAAAKRQRAVGFPLDLVEHVEHPVGASSLELVFGPVGTLVLFRVETLDLDVDRFCFQCSFCHVILSAMSSGERAMKKALASNRCSPLTARCS